SPPPPPPFWASSAARRSAARFSRCSGTSGMALSPSSLQRSAEAAVLADAPEVDGHEDHDDERKEEHVEYVPSKQGVGTDLDTAEQNELHLIAEHRRVPDHVRADGDGPQRQLV